MSGRAHSEAFLRLVEDARSRVREIDTQTLDAKLHEGGRFLVFDVREESEWAAGRIRGARYCGRGVLERDIEGLVPDRSREIVLYCGGGYRSALAADNLQRMGYTNVSSLAGGFRAWKNESRRLDRPRDAR